MDHSLEGLYGAVPGPGSVQHSLELILRRGVESLRCPWFYSIGNFEAGLKNWVCTCQQLEWVVFLLDHLFLGDGVELSAHLDEHSPGEISIF